MARPAEFSYAQGMVPGIEVAYLLSGAPGQFPGVVALPQRGKNVTAPGVGLSAKRTILAP
ncbi:MAG TPA: hypothetical protein VFG71_08110 [Nitrospiraceae bacterium]|nr:hypothetical protein [Nitrospiraceae bacterium]